MLVPALTLPVRGATEFGGHHPGAGVAFGWAGRRPGTQRAGRVEKEGTGRCQHAGRVTRAADVREQLSKAGAESVTGGEVVELTDHGGVVGARATSMGNIPLASPIPSTRSPVSCQCT